MRTTRTWIMLGVALIAGLLAVLLASRWLQEQSSNGVAKIAVAATDISLGNRLTPELVQLVDWPAGSMPPGAFKSINDLNDRVLRTSVLRGEPVLESKLAPQGSKGGLSAVIGEGKRAITVRVPVPLAISAFHNAPSRVAETSLVRVSIFAPRSAASRAFSTTCAPATRPSWTAAPARTA